MILLDILYHNRWSFYLEGGALKASKGVMTVMNGQRLLGNIYILLHTTVVGAAILKSKSNNIVLWHIRLGHIGERGIMQLYKKNLLKGVKKCKLKFYRYCVFRKQNKVQFKTITHKT